MRFTLTIALIAVLAIASLADEPVRTRDCPNCDLPLKGWSIGGFFGIGTFSADSDSPAVTEKMEIESFLSYSLRGGGGLFIYPGGRYRLGIIGGYSPALTEQGDKFLRADALWGILAADLVRTTNVVNLTGGLGIGGGVASLTASELGESGKVTSKSPMFVLSPRFGFEFPIGEISAISFEFTYLWFFGESATAIWQTGDETETTNEMVLSPIELGGPTVSLGLQFGKIRRLRDEAPQGD